VAESDLPSATEFARTVVEEILGRRVEIDSIQPVSGGSVNRVFNYENELVIRVGSGTRAPAAFEKEKWCIARANELEVLAPEVLLIRESAPLVAMVQPKILGSPGVKLKGDAFETMWRQLGRYAKTIHSIAAPGFGDRFLSQHPTSLSWRNWMAYQRSSLLDDEQLWRGLLRRWQLVRIRDRFDKLCELSFDPMLCHANIGERNAIVDRLKNVFLLDWGNAGGYPTSWDLAEVVAWNEPDHSSVQYFCEGYELPDDQRREMKDQLLLIQTWRWLSSIRWAMDTGPNWKKEPVVQLSLEKLKKSIRRW
jgi:hypothetical protein